MNNTSTDSSTEEFKAMITHFKKALAIYKLVGMTVEAKQVEGKIALANRSQNTQNSVSSSAAESYVSQNTRNEYECNMNRFGESSEHTIQSGKNYADNLYCMHRLIEAQRLATKLFTVSRQVHGPDQKLQLY
jgi:predicted sulfurtransferase